MLSLQMIWEVIDSHYIVIEGSALNMLPDCIVTASQTNML